MKPLTLRGHPDAIAVHPTGKWAEFRQAAGLDKHLCQECPRFNPTNPDDWPCKGVQDNCPIPPEQVFVKASTAYALRLQGHCTIVTTEEP